MILICRLALVVLCARTAMSVEYPEMLTNALQSTNLNKGMMDMPEGMLSAYRRGYESDGSECCSPDIVFVIDLTEDSGFSKEECESYLRQFMIAVVNRAYKSACCKVHVALVEYGGKGCIRFDFNTYPTVTDTIYALSQYEPTQGLGKPSRARWGFIGANILIMRPDRGCRKPDSAVFTFWITKTTPVKIPGLIQYVGANVKPVSYVILVAVGDGVNAGAIRPIASGPDYIFIVLKLRLLVTKCKEFYFDFCPRRPTTTPEPTTQPAPTTPVVPSNLCMQCIGRRNHKDLYPDPTDCHWYYQCFYVNSTYAYGIRRPCPAGTFWHDPVLQCMPEGPVPCEDRCLSDDAVHAKGCYAGVGCRQYFVCSNTASYGFCCPVGSRLVENAFGCFCEEDPNCNDPCDNPAPPPSTTASSSVINGTLCRDPWGTLISISTLPGENNVYYLVGDDGSLTEKRYCPETTSFDINTCSCSQFTGATVPSLPAPRRALLVLPFDGNMDDISIHKFEAEPYDGAQVNLGTSAHGSGSLDVNGGRVEIPGLKTHDLGRSASWCAFFRCNGVDFNCNSNGGIVSNNKNSSMIEYTIIMAALTGNNFIANLKFWHLIGQQSSTTPNDQPADGWNHVCVTYDGKTLAITPSAIRVYRNGALIDTQFISGELAVAHCPYTLGHDQFYGTFDGLIDNVLFTSFKMEDDEILAHYNGDDAYLIGKGFWVP